MCVCAISVCMCASMCACVCVTTHVSMCRVCIVRVRVCMSVLSVLCVCVCQPLAPCVCVCVCCACSSVCHVCTLQCQRCCVCSRTKVYNDLATVCSSDVYHLIYVDIVCLRCVQDNYRMLLLLNLESGVHCVMCNSTITCQHRILCVCVMIHVCM